MYGDPFARGSGLTVAERGTGGFRLSKIADIDARGTLLIQIDGQLSPQVTIRAARGGRLKDGKHCKR